MLTVLMSALFAVIPQTQIQAPFEFKSGAEYEKALDNYSLWNDNIDNPEFYKDFSWKGKDFEVKWEDLTEFEKDQLCIVQAFKLEKELLELDHYWSQEIMSFMFQSRFVVPVDPNGEEEVEKEEEVKTTIDDMMKYSQQLTDLRKETALGFEKLLDEMFEKHKLKFSKKETNFVKNQVARFHDHYHLIERNNEEVP